MRPVQPDDLGQHVCIFRVGLAAAGAVPFPITSHLPRIDRIHRVTGGDQSLRPRPSIGLDPNQHPVGLLVLAEVASDQAVQLGQPIDSLHQPAPDQYPTLGVLDLNVVMGLSPIVPDEQHRHFLSLDDHHLREP